MVSIKKLDNNAYWILVGTIFFSVILIITNWVIIDNFADVEADDYIAKFTTEDPEAEFWNDPLGWVGDRLEENDVINMLTLNIEILNSLGFVGSIIKTAIGILITIGIIEVIWIG
jgi:hypothetical protein